MTTWNFPGDLPVTPGGDFADGSGDMTTAVLFAVTAGGPYWITGVRLYTSGSAGSWPNLPRATLYNQDTGALIAQGPQQTISAGGYHFLPFTTPLALSSGVTYAACSEQSSSQKYTAVTLWDGSHKAVGPVYSDTSAGGPFIYADADPTNATSFYWGVDAVVTDSLGGPPPSPFTLWNGAAEVPLNFAGIYDGAVVQPGTFELAP